MNAVLKNILAVIAGYIFGSVINMGIISIGSSIIPPPDGADVTTMEGLKASLPLFETKHFIFPFLAHTLGTFAGALIAAIIAANYKMRMAMIIGLLFLAAGIAMTFMLPSPIWYTIIDLALAYLPMAYLAGFLVVRKKQV